MTIVIHNTRISAIAIISKNRGLGLENHLLFHIPGELPRLKKITMGHPIIMGRKTFESIGRVLPGRTNIIITRDKNFSVEGAVVVHTLEEALEKAKDAIRSTNYELSKTRMHSALFLPHTANEDEVFILGGGQIFKEALPLTDRLYLTVVEKEVPADVFFPDYSEFGKVVEKEEHTEWEAPYTFLTLER